MRRSASTRSGLCSSPIFPHPRPLTNSWRETRHIPFPESESVSHPAMKTIIPYTPFADVTSVATRFRDSASWRLYHQPPRTGCIIISNYYTVWACDFPTEKRHFISIIHSRAHIHTAFRCWKWPGMTNWTSVMSRPTHHLALKWNYSWVCLCKVHKELGRHDRSCQRPTHLPGNERLWSREATDFSYFLQIVDVTLRYSQDNEARLRLFW